MRLKTWFLVLTLPPYILLLALLGVTPQSEFTVTALTIVTLLLAIAARVLLVRKVIEPVIELDRASRRVASGDFSVVMDPRGVGEIGDLRRGFVRMTDQLRALDTAQLNNDSALRTAEWRQRTLADS